MQQLYFIVRMMDLSGKHSYAVRVCVPVLACLAALMTEVVHESVEVRANTYATIRAVLSVMLVMLRISHGARQSATCLPWNTFMAAERWILPRACQPEDRRHGDAELLLRAKATRKQRRLRVFHHGEKTKIEILGKRRSRNGKSRSDDEMLRYIEKSKNSGQLEGAMAKEEMIFERCECMAWTRMKSEQ